MNEQEAGAGWGDDPALRRRLAAVDPAASLPPADPAGVDRLLEETMNSTVDDEVLTAGSRETGTRGRGPLTWLVAAAAVVLIAGAGVFALVHDGPGDPPPTVAPQPTVTDLEAPDAAAYSGRCMAPNADLLAQQTFAFEGTVQQVEGSAVTLKVTHSYTGDASDLVRVTAPDRNLFRALVEAVSFRDGGRYLVSATDGQVTACGFSAEYSPRLAALYAQAFPGRG